MIANFFQSLNSGGVEYLLISGQATVLYGAATFSEDIDLWINPTESNRERFLASLKGCGARYYKLTPRLTTTSLHRGHGFHFVLGNEQNPVFLDIMGNPPRVGDFASANEQAQWMQTEWGDVRTVGIKTLVELKKTQRLEDYPIISKLALAWFDQPECTANEIEFSWAVQNIFTLPELATFFHEHPQAVNAPRIHDALAVFGRQLLRDGDTTETTDNDTREILQSRIAFLQSADRNYWRDIIAELKALRAAGLLMQEGNPV